MSLWSGWVPAACMTSGAKAWDPCHLSWPCSKLIRTWLVALSRCLFRILKTVTVDARQALQALDFESDRVTRSRDARSQSCPVDSAVHM